MTREEVITMFQMRVDGFSLEEIGKRYGVTRERVRQILESAMKSNCRGNAKCIYKGLKNWMLTTGTSGYKMLKDLKFGYGTSSLYARLSGQKTFGLIEIKAILAYTGLTFEEAFGEVEE